MVFKMATATAALVLVLGIGGGTVYAAQDAQFGDPLYPVKLATERARLALSSNKASTHLDIAETRLDELTNATVAGEADVSGRLAAQYRSHVMEALAWAAQASENRSERATERLQEKLELHQMAMEALADEMPETVEGKGEGQAKGPGKPDDVGKPEHAGKPAGAATADDGDGEDNGNEPKRAGQTATDGCFYIKTGRQERYQVWCCGVHLIVKTEKIGDWLGFCPTAQAAVGKDASDPDVLKLLGLEGDESVEHFNFYGPLSKLNQYRPDLEAEEQE